MEANPNYFQEKPKFWSAPADAWRRMIETNLVGVFLMTRAVVPGMLERGLGRIINISTSHPTMVMQGLAAYGAAKAGVEAATVMWAKDLAGTGVTANVLLPGGPADTALVPGGGAGKLRGGRLSRRQGTHRRRGPHRRHPAGRGDRAAHALAVRGRVVGVQRPAHRRQGLGPRGTPELAVAKAMQPQGVAPRIM